MTSTTFSYTRVVILWQHNRDQILAFSDCRNLKWKFSDRCDQNLVNPDFEDQMLPNKTLHGQKMVRPKEKLTASGATEKKSTAISVNEKKLPAISAFEKKLTSMGKNDRIKIFRKHLNAVKKLTGKFFQRKNSFKKLTAKHNLIAFGRGRYVCMYIWLWKVLTVFGKFWQKNRNFFGAHSTSKLVYIGARQRRFY